MTKLLSILLLIPILAQADGIVYNRFTTNSEPLATGIINGAPLTNVPITSVSNLFSALTGLSNSVATGNFIASTNGVGYRTNTFLGIVNISTNLNVTNNAAIGGTLMVEGNSTLQGDLEVQGSGIFAQGITAAANSFTIDGSGNMSTSGNVDVSGTSLFGGTVIFNYVTGSRVPVFGASGELFSSIVTSNELETLSGVTSAIQGQLNGKQPGSLNLTNWSNLSTNGVVFTNMTFFAGRTNPTLVGNVTITTNATVNSNLFVGGSVTATNLTASRLLLSDANKQITNSTVTATEAGYLSGVTGGLQTNIAARVANTNGFSTNQTLRGTITLDGTVSVPAFLTDGVVVADAGDLDLSPVTATELLNVQGGTGNYQTNIDARIRTVDGRWTNSIFGFGTLAVKSNAWFTTLYNTNNFTNAGSVYVTSDIFGASTVYGNAGRITNDLYVGGVLRMTNAMSKDMQSTNHTSLGTNYVKGSISYQSTNIYTVANGDNTIDPGATNTVVYINDSTGSPTAAFNLCGIIGGRADRYLRIYNFTTNVMTVVNNSGTVATAANRIKINADTQIVTNGWVDAFYDSNISRWRIEPQPFVLVASATNFIPAMDFNMNTFSITNAAGIQFMDSGQMSVGVTPFLTWDTSGNVEIPQALNVGGATTLASLDVGSGATTIDNVGQITTAGMTVNDGITTGGLNVLSSSTLNGGVTIYDENTFGTAIQGVIVTNATLDFGLTLTLGNEILTTPLLGVGTNGNWDVRVTAQTHIMAGTGATNFFSASVSATNTISVRYQNQSIAAVNPPSGKYTIVATKTATD